MHLPQSWSIPGGCKTGGGPGEVSGEVWGGALLTGSHSSCLSDKVLECKAGSKQWELSLAGRGGPTQHVPCVQRGIRAHWCCCCCREGIPHMLPLQSGHAGWTRPEERSRWMVKGLLQWNWDRPYSQPPSETSSWNIHTGERRAGWGRELLMQPLMAHTHWQVLLNHLFLLYPLLE